MCHIIAKGSLNSILTDVEIKRSRHERSISYPGLHHDIIVHPLRRSLSNSFEKSSIENSS